MAPLAVVALIGAVLVATGGDDDGGGGDVAGLESVKLATVRIEAKGSFIDPQIGQVEGVGSGTGFMIDSAGIAVTNNHVVTGAASLEVFIEGEDRPRNAKVRGVSECSDLAIIDIDGEGYPFLSWAEANPSTGLDVFAFGFPLGDPEITQTRGIISKARADGETTWASVDNAIEHDAKINPGNSGGPLVLSDGTVAGVNYASFAEADQNFAISSKGVREIVERLREGENVHAIGVNGQAVLDEEAGISGVWVASVESGSPADEAGIQGGDIVTRLEGVTLAEDGTMSEYCDVLRSHDPGDTLSVEVLRFETEEVLKGQINGDALELSFSFAQQEQTDVASGESYDAFREVIDDSARLSVEVPSAWSDIDTTPTDFGGGVLAPNIQASTSIAGFDSYSAPGVAILLIEEFPGDPASATGPSLDAGAETFVADCADSQGRQDYDDGLYLGQFDVYAGCGASGSVVYAVAAYEPGKDFLVIVGVNVITEADLAALDRVISTFTVL